MSIRSFAAAAEVGLMILLAQGLTAEAAEVKVISAIPMTGVMKELGAQFERETGHKLVTKFVTGTTVKREIDTGETFDVAISITPLIDDLAKEGKIVAGTRADVAYSGVGVGVRAGAPKPDISSVEARKAHLGVHASSTVATTRRGNRGVVGARLAGGLHIRPRGERPTRETNGLKAQRRSVRGAVEDWWHAARKGTLPSIVELALFPQSGHSRGSGSPR